MLSVGAAAAGMFSFTCSGARMGRSDDGASDGMGKQAQPQPLLMFIYARTGSSLMTETLNLHPRIVFTSELFNSNSDWVGADPRAERFFAGDYKGVYEHYRNRSIQYTVPQKAFNQLHAVGFKVRNADAGLLPGSEQWHVLERVRPKIICSYRKSQVKAALSHLRGLDLAKHCGTANIVQRHNCSLAAGWVPSPDAFKEALTLYHNETQRLMNACSRAAESFNTMFVAYEDLLDGLPGIIGRILRFIDMPAADKRPFMAALQGNSLPIGLRKNTPDDLTELLPPDSLRELQAVAEQMYASEAAASFS